MKKILLALSFTLLSLHAQTGEEIFTSNCVACHAQTAPVGMGERGTPAFKEAMSKLKAPPMPKVSMKLKMQLQDKEAFVAFVSDYITNPSKEKAKCNPRAVKAFGLMPPIGKSMSEAERKSVAEWMFETYAGKSCSACSSCEGKKGKNEGKKGKNTEKKSEMKCQAGKCGGK